MTLQKIKDKIKYWYNELEKLQDNCKHIGAKEFQKSNTDEYGCDSPGYYIEFKCSKCDKFWMENY